MRPLRPDINESRTKFSLFDQIAVDGFARSLGHRSQSQKRTEDNVAADEYDDDDIPEVVDDDQFDDLERKNGSERGRRHLSRGRLAHLSDRIAGGAARPGEQQIARSPFVLILVGGVLGIGLLAAIFYYIIGREGESRRLKEAMLALEQQKYAEAEQLFLKFLEIYPQGSSSSTARLSLHKSRVEKFIMTTTPDVTQGMKELNDLIRIGKDLDGFDAERENIRRYADRLTFAGARVGEIIQQPEPLEISKEAMEVLRRFSPETGIPRDREEILVRHQRIAEAAIIKKLAFNDAVKQVRDFLEAGRTVDAINARQALVDRYEVLKDDKDVDSLLKEILQKEQQLVTRTDVGRDGSTTDEGQPLPSLSLTLRTQAAGDQVSQGRLIFTVGMDTVFALDANTGEPQWKRVIGAGPAFAPMALNGSEALLVYSSRSEELMLLNQNDGQLIWRQTLGARPSGNPLIHGQQIYVTTEQNELWQLSAVNGRALARVTFPQPVIGPPTLTRDETRLLIPGDQMMIYTLSLTPLNCLAVSFVPHRTGSIQTPMLTAGAVYVLCDNDSAEKCRVRVLSLNDSTNQLSVRTTESVDGQVRDPMLLRARQLFIPSSPQRITAFQITDEPEQNPLARIGANQLEDGEQTRMFLLAGPGGQLWLGGRDLRKFQTTTNALLLDSGVTAEGTHLQPIQFVDEGVFLTTRSRTLSSIFCTRADREQMQGLWRTVVGTNVVALGPAVGNQSLLAVGDFGEVFRVALRDVDQGGFALEAVSNFRLPDKLASAVSGLALPDGRLAAWCGEPEPAVWTFSPTGQLERKWNLPDVPQTAPVALKAGIAFALPGRLHLTALTGGTSVEDYRAAQTGNQQSAWKSLTALNDTELVAVDAENQLVRVEYRTAPRPQLAEISVTRMDHPIEVAPTTGHGFLFVATADGQLLMLQASTFEVLAEAELGGVPSQSPFVVGDRVFVAVAGHELKAFVTDNSLRQTGVLSISGNAVVGPPALLTDGFLVALSDGTVSSLTAEGMPTDRTFNLGQSLSRGPVRIDERLLVVAVDGSLYALPAELSQ